MLIALAMPYNIPTKKEGEGFLPGSQHICHPRDGGAMGKRTLVESES